MKVLMITGDKHLFIPDTPSYERLLIQKKYADITPVFWGHGALCAPFKEMGVFDVVTVQDPFWRGLVGLIISLYKRAQFNVQVHTDLNAQSFVRRVLARAVLRHADSIRVVSLKLKTQVEELGVHGLVTVLPILLDIGRFSSVSKNTDTNVKKNILWIGRFEDEKNPIRAIDILKEVLSEGIDAELIMLGAGSLENTLRRKAKGLPVLFPGWKDPVEYLSTADVLLNTSRYEGYGAAIVEALATGTPVVAPDVGIAREAGAVIAPEGRFASTLAEVLRSNKRGELKIQLLSKDEWGAKWKETL